MDPVLDDRRSVVARFFSERRRRFRKLAAADAARRRPGIAAVAGARPPSGARNFDEVRTRRGE